MSWAKHKENAIICQLGSVIKIVDGFCEIGYAIEGCQEAAEEEEVVWKCGIGCSGVFGPLGSASGFGFPNLYLQASLQTTKT